MENLNPTFSRPVSKQAVTLQNNFNPTVKNISSGNLYETDNLLNEKEQSLKKKIFSLAKMESLVFEDPKLTSVYNEMALNGEEKYGYHYNETIMNMIFNDYILNSAKYLQKYKMSIPKEKKRRDKSGINKLKHDGEAKMNKMGTKIIKNKPVEEPSVDNSIDETTSAGSAGGDAGYVGYAGPSAWSNKGDLLGTKGKPIKKPIYSGGAIVEDKDLVEESKNYLIDPMRFTEIVYQLNEEIERAEADNFIGDNTAAFSSKSIKNWDNDDEKVELNTLLTGKMDEDMQTIIGNKEDSMANRPNSSDGQYSGVEMGMNSGMSEEVNNIKLSENSMNNNLLNEIENELKAFSVHQDKLKEISEDKKPSSLILKDRLGDENKSNFKKDLNHSGTKKTIDIEKELQWKDQQTEIGKDAQKLSSDIEKEVLKKTKGEAFENVGDSDNSKGNEIPKRNITTDEVAEVETYRRNLKDFVFDNEPGEKFEERMKADMGEENYKQRQVNQAALKAAPMYSKDVQPTRTVALKETMVTGRYYNEMGKSHMIDFQLGSAKVADNVLSEWASINLTGLGNAYANKVDSSSSKLTLNEDVESLITENKFYVDKDNNIFVIKGKKSLNEGNTSKKEVISEELTKIKHLLKYNPNDFTDTTGSKVNRGF